MSQDSSLIPPPETGRTIAKEDTRPDSTRCLLSNPRFLDLGVQEHETSTRALLDDGTHAPAPTVPLLLGRSEEEEKEADLGGEKVGERRATAMALCRR